MTRNTHTGRADWLDYAAYLANTGRPFLARLCAEEAARLTPDPTDAAHILAAFPDPVRSCPCDCHGPEVTP